MGCDIHMVIERNIDGRWITWRTFGSHNLPAWQRQSSKSNYGCHVARDRNYRRFGKLAGVRGDGPVALGVPDDLSETARALIEHDGPDGHSHSWISLRHAAAIFAETEPWLDSEDEEFFGRKYPLSFFFDIEDEEADDCRLVFWFDN